MITKRQARQIAKLFLAALAHHTEVGIANADDNALSSDEVEQVDVFLWAERDKILKQLKLDKVPVTFEDCVSAIVPNRKSKK